MAKKSGRFRLRRHASVGAAAAEEDAHFLQHCFVDTGDLEILRDCENPKRIVVGRTGSGKTALLKRLQETEEHVIEVSPVSLSLEHISNSQVLQFFTEVGVN